MKQLRRLVATVLLVVNIIVVCLLLFAAYSPNLNPETHPLRACMGLTFPIFLVMNLCFFCFWLIFRFRFALLPFAGFLLCAPQIRTYFPINFRTSNVPQETFKMLSYNVMGFGDLTKIEGKNPVLTYLQGSEADIICLQEYVVSANQKYVTKEDIERALLAYPYKHIRYIGGNGVACYSKYPIVSASPVHYASQNNGSVVYEIAMGSDTLTLINNHLESNKLTALDKKVYEEMIEAPEAEKMKHGIKYLVQKLGNAQQIRAVQARAVAQAVEKARYPNVIVCGDFNDSPISYTHKTISKNLRDAFISSGRGLGISYNQNKFYFRIDNILVSKNLKTYNCTVDRSIKHSDHYPIWCYIGKR